MKYEEWLAQVPEALKRDPLWKFDAYPNLISRSGEGGDNTLQRIVKQVSCCKSDSI
jgi:hypothetical protein